MENLTAIILAAGKGTRMQSSDKNKVSLEIHGEPMLLRTIRILRSAGMTKIIVVVGFAKDSVVSLLDEDVSVAEQKEQLGTGHAVFSALIKIPESTKDVLILYGDDSFLYSPETFRELYKTHLDQNAQITFITMISENPTGFGRIIRENEKIVGIVEEKNSSDDQKKIKEINLGCYIINKSYLAKNIKNIKKNEVTGEYYITDIIDIIASQGGKIAAYKLKNAKWRGVNTREDLEEAEKLIINEQ